MLASTALKSQRVSLAICFFFVCLKETSPQVFMRLNFAYQSFKQIFSKHGMEFSYSLPLLTSVFQK